MAHRLVITMLHQTNKSRSALRFVSRFQYQTRSFSIGGQVPAGSDQKSYREEYCRNQVNKQDYESYLIGLLLPKEYQSSFFAIRAFNIEIATIKDQIPKNTNNIARIRFQFWRDILHEMHETRKVPEHINQPVALELLDATLQYNLTVRWLERNLEARYSDVVNNGNFADYNGLEDYAEFSHSSLVYLMLEVFGLRDDTALNYAASHIGVCKGIVTLLRSMPYHSSMGMCYYPRDLMKKFQLTEKMVVDGPKTPQDTEIFKNITHDVASQAYAHVEAARKQYKNVPSAHRKLGIYALLPVVQTKQYLDALAKYEFDPYITSHEFNNNTTPLSLQYQLLKTSKFSKSF